jgi:hypothetical protein
MPGLTSDSEDDEDEDEDEDEDDDADEELSEEEAQRRYFEDRPEAGEGKRRFVGCFLRAQGRATASSAATRRRAESGRSAIGRVRRIGIGEQGATRRPDNQKRARLGSNLLH